MRWITTMCGAVMMVAGSVSAGELNVPFTYQGRLMQNDVPVSGPVLLAFRMYDSAEAGTEFGTENVFPGFDNFLMGGLFTVELDFGEVFDGGERWLEIDVNGVTLTPRQPLRATPYAVRALQGGDGGEGIWDLNGSSAFYAGGRVGIGTFNPGAPLEVQSGAGRTRLGNDVGSIRTRLTFIDSDDQDTFIEKLDGGRLRFRVGGTSTRMTITADGNVGIGTQNPAVRLDVNGQARASSVTATANLGQGVPPELGTQYADNTIVAWARILGNGVIDDSFGISSAVRIGPGNYTVTFANVYDTPMVASVTAFSSNDPVITSASVSTSGATVRTFEQVNQGGQIFFTAGDRPFYIIVTGRGGL